MPTKSILAASMLALFAIASLGADAEKPMEKISVGDIGSHVQLMGTLGKPLGTYILIEGTYPAKPNVMIVLLEVDTIDGKKLDKPISIRIDGLGENPAGQRVSVRGYESCGMQGVPVDPENLDKVGQQAYGFYDWFVVTQKKAARNG